MTLNVVLDGLILGESPRWHDGRLWVADWAAHELITLDADGTREVVERPTAIPCCIDWLPDGRLLLVSGDRLVRQEQDGTLVTHAELRNLDPHAWNDIAVDKRGNAFVGCIGFDFPGGGYAPGILAVVTPDGTARRAAEGLAFPNGMVVTPDDGTLIVAESYGNRLTAFAIGEDGSLSDRRVWAELPGDHPDGICLDAEGAVWAADVGNRHCVRVREGGEVVQTIDADLGCYACALGGPDGRTLYIVTSRFPNDFRTPAGRVLSVQVDVPSAAA
ncbi:SMP-30/gluconolactonase/LRE family protein [Sinomonas sp. JGH33]|uniref:SMP-30/gluconolactonase/LRE family protein n=1 Tax=Sinomonas terricola TaxID=3110330 RepID=A0ABU5TBQ6_9MICC|nr:SMP-30/gluconolactonase/LRE family protein [Sinomonas sp. JGH33]MEA5457128.1 SMP-30/gluconolactonase/LRE family protein [Sinomonas sp. JGH33]